MPVLLRPRMDDDLSSSEDENITPNRSRPTVVWVRGGRTRWATRRSCVTTREGRINKSLITECEEALE